jgi:hypothetical protein
MRRPFVFLPPTRRPPPRVLGLIVCLHCVAAVAGGCARESAPLVTSLSNDPSPRSVDPQHIQAATMSFADRYLAAMADAYERARIAAPTPQAALAAQRLKILAGIGATGNAVDPNPVVGLMDMAVMVTLTRQITQDPWARATFGKESADAVAATLEVQEADVWRIADSYFSHEQIGELHHLAARWRSEHPDQRYVAGARLADFPESKAGGGGGFAQPIAGSIFGLVTLDPFHGLDPAVKEVAQSRVLAERLFFYLRHTPVLMSWQADALFGQMLAEPQVTRLFTDVTTISGSTTRFSDATDRFSDASSRIATSVEKFRLQLPEQQARLVGQLDELLARQRDGALKQATTQVSIERDATIEQLNTSVAAQRAAMAGNLQSLSDQSIDRVYQRVRALVLITVGSVLTALLLYRWLVTRSWQTKADRRRELLARLNFDPIGAGVDKVIDKSFHDGGVKK